MSPTPSQAIRPEGADPTRIGPNAFAVFRVGPWRFGLPIGNVVEALTAARIRHLPDAPTGVEGYLDLRGDALPVFDLRLVLGSPTVALRPSHHFLVCRRGRRRVVLWVDRVLHLEGDLRPTDHDSPAAERPRHVEILARSDDGIILIQDLDALLRPDEAEGLRRALRSLADDGDAS